MVIGWLKTFFCLKGKGSLYGNSMVEDIFFVWKVKVHCMVIRWLKKFFCLKGKGSFYGNSMVEDVFLFER